MKKQGVEKEEENELYFPLSMVFLLSLMEERV
jgi:hypothetical protein